MRGRPGIAILSVLLALPAAATAAERVVALDPVASRVTFILGTTFHEVHGTMALTAGVIRFDPGTGAASGTITVDARRTETGNKKRDKTMHEDVLESERFPTIGFRVVRIEGRLVDPGRSELKLVGVMSLHGADHPMTLQATVESANGRVSGTLRFPIPYVEWGLRDPSFLVARTKKIVEVTVHAEGTWRNEGPAAR